MKRQILMSVIVFILFADNSFAGRMWFYNQLTDSGGMPVAYNPVSTDIGMRSGDTWPVVGYSEGGMENGVAVMIPGGWIDSAGGLDGSYIDAATAPDGTVAFADNEGHIRMLSPYGFTSASYSGEVVGRKASVAFNNDSIPAVLHNDYGNMELYLTMKSGPVWYKSQVTTYGGSGFIYSTHFALQFDSYNQANIAFVDDGHLRYGVKGVMTGGQWVFSDPMIAPMVSGELDMVLTDSDVPYVAYNTAGSLTGAVYDVHSDSWVTETLDTLLNPGNFCIAADGRGGVGIAYVAEFEAQDMLSFIYNDGITGWSTPQRLTPANMNCMVGLAFDAEDNPVISFCDDAGGLYIAYDPVEVPEPVTLAVLALGFAFIRRKGRWG